jgi:TRAP-type C4-dicarboxylate transport system substrate-binding protein
VRLQVESQLESKNKEFDVLAEQFKKETALRKKYKNELEDLKGIALRVVCSARNVRMFRWYV